MLLVLMSPPDEPRTVSCLNLARTLKHAGEDVEVLLLQDAVLLPTQKPSEGKATFDGAIKEGVRVLLLEDDLRLRGFAKHDLGDSAQLTSYRQAIRRMAQTGLAVKGCF